MLYYLDRHVDWTKRSGRSELETEVMQQIQEIRDKYFSEKSLGYVKVVYPKGEPEEVHRVFGILKKFPIDLRSGDGTWRYSKGRPRVDKKNNLQYDDHHLNVTHQTLLKEKDIELVWYLIHKAPAVKSKKIYIENLEEEAKQEVAEMATDVDVRYALFGKTSPVAKDEKLVRDVAEIFGVKDVSKLGINQVKVNLFDKLVEGNARSDRFINFEKFEELTEGNVKRKAAFHTRRSINDGVVGYKDRAWWIKEGREYVEKLLDIRPIDVEYREELLIEEVVKNSNIRSRLFAAIGEDETMTIEDLRELDRSTLMRHANDRGLGDKYGTSSKKEDLVKLLCEDMQIEYKSKSA